MNRDPQPQVETAPRVRLAPSPTGGLHIGTARTALFNWLFARKHRGTFVLRIEDTDRARSTTQYEHAIIADLHWLGLEWDEGVAPAKGSLGPYRQTERADLYQPFIKQLLDSNQAYPCFCTPEQLAEDRALAQQAGKPITYVGRCATLTPEQRAANKKAGKKSVLRFRAQRQPIEVSDLVHGTLQFHGNDFGDFVIAKPKPAHAKSSEYEPLFMLANIIDDALMKISHVIRGEDHLPNLPKQVLLAKALGFSLPQYAHIPLILNPDRSKMSKRAGPTHVGEYRKLGYLPEAIVNYIALLGWNPGTTQEIFTREELIAAFNLKQINKAGSVFDIKRLQWMNSQYLRKLSDDALLKQAEPFWPAEAKGSDKAFKSRVLTTVKERLTHLAELPELTQFYFAKKLTIDKTLLTWKKSTPQESLEALKRVRDHIAGLDAAVFASAAELEKSLKEFVTQSKQSVGEVFWPLRVALSGSKASPGPQEILWVLGQKKSLERIDAALA